VYQSTARRDGYVSFEVSPYLAHNTEQTIAEARRLHELVARENVMIKVPGTPEGIPAIRQLISEGININVTLLFSRQMYEAVAEAYIQGLEQLLQRSGDLSRVASVASFFVSRIDSAADAQLASVLKAHPGDPAIQEAVKSVSGWVAIANAKLAYQDYKRICATARWQNLAQHGAQTQRLLWASTSTKNPNYRDVMYVEELIGPDTVNTVPPSTLEAFRDHGRVEATLENDLDEAREVLNKLESLGISLRGITDKLLQEAVALFAESFDKLMSALEKRRTKAAPATTPGRFEFRLPADLNARVRSTLESWRAGGNMRRLWAGDASLWTNSDEANWLGWLRITEGQIPHVPRLAEFASQVAQAGFQQAVLLGMGGSSLTPEVFKRTLGSAPGFPELFVLDSTDPQQIRDLEAKLDLGHTLFIVSSKSGTTLEPNILHQYFFDRVTQLVGRERAGEHFIAVTDPGSKVERAAQAQNFRRVFPGLPSIGGRYSALSNFGLVPAAIMGVDLKRLLDRTEEMVQACSSTVAIEHNPGAILGVILGTLAKAGIDKVTVVASPGIADLGAWLEQLLAESTGKQGKGLIPVDGEQLGAPNVYGKDRLFVYARLASAPDTAQDAAFSALENAGQPVVRITVPEPYDIGQEFFRWEIATAVAGAVMNLNPFNQPDVEASKVVTRELAAEYEQSGRLPSQPPAVSERGVQLFSGDSVIGTGTGRSLADVLRAHLDSLQDGDYFAILAYLEMNKENEQLLQEIRHTVRDRKRVATCLGFGPRFLHSTGQAYKGGPNTGVFLQITADDAVRLPVPGRKYTFGIIKAAQALGDLRVLTARGRRVLRAHLTSDVAAGLKVLQSAISDAVGQLRTAA
jgi:transaldolase/glucose-6-phosphate isomerase